MPFVELGGSIQGSGAGVGCAPWDVEAHDRRSLVVYAIVATGHFGLRGSLRSRVPDQHMCMFDAASADLHITFLPPSALTCFPASAPSHITLAEHNSKNTGAQLPSH